MKGVCISFHGICRPFVDGLKRSGHYNYASPKICKYVKTLSLNRSLCVCLSFSAIVTPSRKFPKLELKLLIDYVRKEFRFYWHCQKGILNLVSFAKRPISPNSAKVEDC